jgi:hypothetical protein
MHGERIKILKALGCPRSEETLKTMGYAVPVFGAGYRSTVKSYRTLPRKLLSER